TLEKVFNRVDALSQNCYDQFINVNDVSFDNLDSVKIAGESHPLRTIAQRSITWRLGIPYQYLRKCPPEIQSLNLNYWIEHEKNDQLFFRMDGQEVRAIFTPKYKPVDNFEICERLDSLGYGPETHVQCSLDPEFMSLSILDGKKAFDVNGDKFRNGISLSNSEVGLASLSIAAFLLRLVCTNGMVSKTEISASYRHVSTKILEEFPATMDKVSYELGAQKHKIGLSMESPVDEPLKTIETFNRQFSLNQSQKEAVVEWAWPKEMGDTMFAVVNTYTRASQFKGLSAENSYQLQRVGGNILGMLN
ncbi:DUF932 domain-containing protein, partial [Thermodesulfobacteriota bacterium]